MILVKMHLLNIFQSAEVTVSLVVENLVMLTFPLLAWLVTTTFKVPFPSLIGIVDVVHLLGPSMNNPRLFPPFYRDFFSQKRIIS